MVNCDNGNDVDDSNSFSNTIGLRGGCYNNKHTLPDNNRLQIYKCVQYLHNKVLQLNSNACWPEVAEQLWSYREMQHIIQFYRSRFLHIQYKLWRFGKDYCRGG